MYHISFMKKEKDRNTISRDMNDMEKMYLCEKEVRGIYQRRTET